MLYFSKSLIKSVSGVKIMQTEKVAVSDVVENQELNAINQVRKIISVQENIEKSKELMGSKIIQKGIKRVFDIFVGVIGVILLIPITIVVYIINKIIREDDGPIFYKQTRIGKGGKHFTIYKYRTMIVDADKVLEEYLEQNPDRKKEFEENQKLTNDPRVTKLGKILRKTSMDELPQLINMLKGDMSLIGPRPIVDREVELFGDSMPIVHSVRPGITGYWAVNGRSTTTYAERVQMERYYAEHFSLWLDIKIFFKTFIAVLKREGAL